MQEGGCSEQERRRYARLETSVRVSYTVISSPGKVEVFSKNISAGGLCLLLDQAFAPETSLQLVIKIPDLKDPIHALGRVVWQRKDISSSEERFETGIEFTGISDFDRFNINRYVLDNIEPEK